MSIRRRVYLTLSIKDADLLAELMSDALSTELGERDPDRLEKIMNRLVDLTEAQRPNLAEGAFEEPPDDFDGPAT